MTTPTKAELPLAAASARLKGKPGRPRKGENGHSAGTTDAGSRMNSGQERGALASPAIAPLTPRLLDLRAAGLYLSLGERRLRDLVAAGGLPRVRVPLPNGGELRKILLDREDLDRLIAAWKDPASEPFQEAR